MKPARVAEFVREHWYAMDARGVEAGIFTEYELLECAPDSDLCDYAMIVGYPQALGYSDPGTQDVFTAIREEHERLNPGAADLRSVMSIVGSETLSALPD